jgi:ATP-dependent Lhr-like helicase
MAYEVLSEQGASFFHDLVAATGLLPAQVEDALSELAALGLVTADGFATIRLLVSPDRRRAADARRRRDRRPGKGVRNLLCEAPFGPFQQKVPDPFSRPGGRWARFPSRIAPPEPAARVEAWCRQLLRRYGIVFRDLLARESAAPPWRELAGVYRRWEAQGKVRGGRFVLGVAGEQFAQHEAVTELRRLRDDGPTEEWVAVSACDPLNLAGIVTPGCRVPAVLGNSLVYVDGRLAASQQAGQVTFHETMAPELAERMIRALNQSAAVRHERAAALALTHTNSASGAPS